MPYFTFYCLVKSGSEYVMKPHINIYNNMIEIIDWNKNV
jgi:hypothetical protein